MAYSLLTLHGSSSKRNTAIPLLLSVINLTFLPLSSSLSSPFRNSSSCQHLSSLQDRHAKCLYLQSQTPCVPLGYIDYFQLFYCTGLGDCPLLGYAFFFLLLSLLFYLLGDTASQYFCPSLVGLSGTLRLPPAIAGVTLLSLGNGAPDVFASVVSFASSSDGIGSNVGISGVLGGALFVSTAVTGAISMSVARSGRPGVIIERQAFLRDACFLMLVLGALLAILVMGKITIASGIVFLSLYVGYVTLVWLQHCCIRGDHDSDAESAPLLQGELIEEVGDGIVISTCGNSSKGRNWFLHLLKMLIDLPRRLTIPVVTEDRWSKPFAVSSVALSPVLVAALWNEFTARKPNVYIVGAAAGLVLAAMVMMSTHKDWPPRKCSILWLVGGFAMSVTWAYMTASELVSLLVSIGFMLDISPSVLGLTVLAWGNSLGDLTANVAMAVHGGRAGAQIALSGCYAGPLFNVSVGLGVSMLLATWSSDSSPLVLQKDMALFETLCFMVAGLLWALLVLIKTDMRLDKMLGMGLLGLYSLFLFLRIGQCIGLFDFMM